MKHNPKPNKKDVPWPNANLIVKGALSRNFCCFPSKTFRRVIHGTFLVCLRDGYKNFEKLRLNFEKCNPSSSLPSTTTDSSKQSQWSYLVLVNKVGLGEVRRKLPHFTYFASQNSN